MGSVGGSRPSLSQASQRFNFQSTQVTSGRITITPDNWQQTLRAVGGDDAVLSLTPDQRQQLFENGRLEVQYDATFQQAGEGSLTLLTKGICALFAPSKSLSAMHVDQKAVEMLQDPTAELGFGSVRQTRGRLRVFEPNNPTEPRRPVETPESPNSNPVQPNDYSVDNQRPERPGAPEPWQEYQEQVTGKYAIAHSMEKYDAPTSAELRAMSAFDKLNEYYKPHTQNTQSGHISRMNFGPDVSMALSGSGWRGPSAPQMAQVMYGPDMAQLNELAGAIEPVTTPPRTFADLTPEQAAEMYDNAPQGVKDGLEQLAQIRFDTNFSNLDQTQLAEFAQRTEDTQTQLDAMSQNRFGKDWTDLSRTELNTMGRVDQRRVNFLTSATIRNGDDNVENSYTNLRAIGPLTNGQAGARYSSWADSVEGAFNLAGDDEAGVQLAPGMESLFNERYEAVNTREDHAAEYMAENPDATPEEVTADYDRQMADAFSDASLADLEVLTMKGTPLPSPMPEGVNLPEGVPEDGTIFDFYAARYDSARPSIQPSRPTDPNDTEGMAQYEIAVSKFRYVLETNTAKVGQSETFTDDDVAIINDIIDDTFGEPQLDDNGEPVLDDHGEPVRGELGEDLQSLYLTPDDFGEMQDLEAMEQDGRDGVIDGKDRQGNEIEGATSRVEMTNDGSSLDGAGQFYGRVSTTENPNDMAELGQGYTTFISSMGEQIDALPHDANNSNGSRVDTEGEIAAYRALGADIQGALDNLANVPAGTTFPVTQADGTIENVSVESLREQLTAQQTLLNERLAFAEAPVQALVVREATESSFPTGYPPVTNTTQFSINGLTEDIVNLQNGEVDSVSEVAHFSSVEGNMQAFVDGAVQNGIVTPVKLPRLDEQGNIEIVDGQVQFEEFTDQGAAVERLNAMKESFSGKLETSRSTTGENHLQVDQEFMQGIDDGFGQIVRNLRTINPSDRLAAQGVIDDAKGATQRMSHELLSYINDQLPFERRMPQESIDALANNPVGTQVALTRLSQQFDMAVDETRSQFNQDGSGTVDAETMGRVEEMQRRFQDSIRLVQDTHAALGSIEDNITVGEIETGIANITRDLDNLEDELESVTAGNTGLDTTYDPSTRQTVKDNLIDNFEDMFGGSRTTFVNTMKSELYTPLPDGMTDAALDEALGEVYDQMTADPPEISFRVRLFGDGNSASGGFQANESGQGGTIYLRDSGQVGSLGHGAGQSYVGREEMLEMALSTLSDRGFPAPDRAGDIPGGDGSGNALGGDVDKAQMVVSVVGVNSLPDSALDSIRTNPGAPTTDQTLQQAGLVDPAQREFVLSALATEPVPTDAESTKARILEAVRSYGESADQLGGSIDMGHGVTEEGVVFNNPGDEVDSAPVDETNTDIELPENPEDEEQMRRAIDIPVGTFIQSYSGTMANSGSLQFPGEFSSALKTYANSNQEVLGIENRVQSLSPPRAREIIGMHPHGEYRKAIAELVPMPTEITTGPGQTVAIPPLSETQVETLVGAYSDISTREGEIDSILTGAGITRASDRAAITRALENGTRPLPVPEGIELSEGDILSVTNRLDSNRADRRTIDRVLTDAGAAEGSVERGVIQRNIQDRVAVENVLFRQQQGDNGTEYEWATRADQASEDTGSKVRNFLVKAFELMEQFDQVVQKLVAKIKQKWYEHLSQTISRNDPQGTDPLANMMKESIKFAGDMAENTQLLHTAMKHVTDKVWNDPQFLERWKDFGGADGSAARDDFVLNGRDESVFGTGMNARNVAEMRNLA